MHSTVKGMVISMKHNIPVECLIDRSWNPRTKCWDGQTVGGTLIDFTAQSAEDNSGRLTTVGVVVLESGAIECVPVEFIKCITF